MEVTRDNLVIWFIKNYPYHYVDMNDSSHAYSIDNPSPYHHEGSVWTHTMMVMTYIEMMYKTHPSYIPLILTGLLHDIGKPAAQEFIPASNGKPNRYMFKGHEGISTHGAVEILLKLEQEFTQISKVDIKIAIQLISLHGVSLNESTSYLVDLRRLFMDADRGGAIRVPETSNDHYDTRKFIKPTKEDPTKHLILMVGIPCTGKSTYITKNYPDYYVVSRDDALESFYAEVHNDRVLTTYTEIYAWVHSRSEYLDVFNKYFNTKVKEARKHDKIIVDMTMTNLKSRRQMMSQFPQHSKHAVVLMTSEENIYARNRKRQGKLIPDYVFQNMMKSFVFPVKDEGFTSIVLQFT